MRDATSTENVWSQHFDAAYTWDTAGRMTSINYGPQYQLTYDANGRLGGMSGSDLTMTASYGPAGEMLGLSYQGLPPGWDCPRILQSLTG